MERSFSVYLDVLRFSAAVLVFFSHVPKYIDYNLWQLSGLGHESVIIFFVLSGFVISYVVFDKKETAKEYASKRFARIYSVALPALLFSVFAYYAGKEISPEALAPVVASMSNEPVTFVKSLFFLNESWGSTTVFTNLPYWSLAFEVQYYVLFGVIIFMTNKLKWLVVAMIMLIMGPSIVLYAPIWGAGVLCYWLYKKYQVSRLVAMIGWLVSVAGAILFSMEYSQDIVNAFGKEYLPSILYSSLEKNRHIFLSDYTLTFFVMFNMFFAANLFRAKALLTKRLDKWVQFAASHTFALYLFHQPLMYLMQSIIPFSENKIMGLFGILVLTPVIILAVSIYIEKTKHVYLVFFNSTYSKIIGDK